MTSGSIISADLFMSPGRTDCIFTSLGGGWRTVSEDIQKDGGLSSIHALYQRRDLRDAVELQMARTIHQRQDLNKQLEVMRLGRTQRNILYERDDAIRKIASPANTPPIHVFTMVIVSRVPIDGSTSEELLQNLKSTHAACSLRHDELWTNLPAEPRCGTPINVHAKAAFSVDEARDPAF